MSGLVFRRSIPCAMRGRYAAMMDMGGMSPGKDAAKKINAGKNNKVRAVAFDFHLLIQSMANDKTENSTNNPNTSAIRPDEPKLQTTSTILPDVGTVQSMANLLNIDLGGNKKKQLTESSSSSMDGESIGELSAVFDAALLAEQTTPDNSATTQSPSSQQKEPKRFTTKAPPMSDIRNKYAKQLRDKMESGGSVSGIDLARQETGAYNTRGDAASHLVARAMASASPPPSTAAGSKWLASTGTGTLLMFLTSRSMKLALLPTSTSTSAGEDVLENGAEGQRMEELTKQLPSVVFSLLVKDGSSFDTPSDMMRHVLKEWNEEKTATMVVSDRDHVLKAGRELGMFTCRIRAKNAPRGNVTTHYNVETVAEVQEIVNEINGISFNTVFSSNATINYA
mmetsp:Transcript_9444/g.17117  ORF Transcript_9444/g.17117 Transcript_9444/m.17117 type:complete len:395 (-) Transcript_9444:120-1304(-)